MREAIKALDLLRLEHIRRIKVDRLSAEVNLLASEIKTLQRANARASGEQSIPERGDATAAFTVIDIDPEEKTINAAVYRASYDTEKVADAISARGLTGDTYRAATLRSGKLVR